MWTIKADIAFFIFAWIFRTSGSKMGIFRGKIREGVRRYWPPTNSFLLLGVYTSVSNLVKIDKEMRPSEWAHTDRHTHTQTDGQTDANQFYICPMLYAIAMGQIINRQFHACRCRTKLKYRQNILRHTIPHQQCLMTCQPSQQCLHLKKVHKQFEFTTVVILSLNINGKIIRPIVVRILNMTFTQE